MRRHDVRGEKDGSHPGYAIDVFYGDILYVGARMLHQLHRTRGAPSHRLNRYNRNGVRQRQGGTQIDVDSPNQSNRRRLWK